MKLRNKSNKINRLRRIRSWELKNLPIYGTDAGYALFLEIAALEELDDVSLKSLYLSMPYAESTIRLLFRNLEEDGWVELRKHVVDQRIKTFIPTQKFSFVVDQWLDHVDECLGTD